MTRGPSDRLRARRGERARRILRVLAETYPDAKCGLHFETPFQLLTATLLSAQTADAGVNRITPELWRRWPDPSSLAGAPARSLEALLRPLGLFRAKARNLKACAARLGALHAGKVPGTLEELGLLPGVGRKTARVVLGEVFGRPGIVVDTHMARVSRRLGLTASEDPLEIEADLDRVVPERERTLFSHRVIAHGRQVCKARKPGCEACPLRALCPWPPSVITLKA